LVATKENIALPGLELKDSSFFAWLIKIIIRMALKPRFLRIKARRSTEHKTW
jgi:hypothetical protein